MEQSEGKKNVHMILLHLPSISWNESVHPEAVESNGVEECGNRSSINYMRKEISQLTNLEDNYAATLKMKNFKWRN